MDAIKRNSLLKKLHFIDEANKKQPDWSANYLRKNGFSEAHGEGLKECVLAFYGQDEAKGRKLISNMKRAWTKQQTGGKALNVTISDKHFLKFTQIAKRHKIHKKALVETMIETWGELDTQAPKQPKIRSRAPESIPNLMKTIKRLENQNFILRSTIQTLADKPIKECLDNPADIKNLTNEQLLAVMIELIGTVRRKIV